jgi:hypothetical protein
MTPLSKRVAGVIITVSLVALSFGLGRWSAALQKGLEDEARYPWELHRKLALVELRCETPLNAAATGRFYVQPEDDGATLIVSTFDRGTGMVTAFALGTSGRVAMDSWPLDCK